MKYEYIDRARQLVKTVEYQPTPTAAELTKALDEFPVDHDVVHQQLLVAEFPKEFGIDVSKEFDDDFLMFLNAEAGVIARSNARYLLKRFGEYPNVLYS